MAMGNAGGIVIRLKIYRISASLKISKKNKKIYKDLLEPFDFSKFKGKNVLPKELLPSIDGLIQEGKNPKNIAENLNVEYTTKFRNGIYERKRKLKNK